MLTGKINKEIVCSLILGLYILLVLAYYFIGSFRFVFLPLILFLSFVSLMCTQIPKRIVLYLFTPYICVFFIGFLIQLLQNRIFPFILFIPASAFLGYFIFKNKFDLKILYIILIVISSVFIYKFVIYRSFEEVFFDLSRNYVSVFYIMFSSLITIIILRQTEKIVIFPFFLAFVFSFMAIGRAGIICTLTLLIITLFFRFKKMKLRQKKILGLVIILPLLFIIILEYDKMILLFDGISFLERFSEKGVKSPSRGILLAEYMGNINIKTFIGGYNFDHNHWFIHYGLNPHNSYIRMHSRIGIMSLFFIFTILLIIMRFLSKKSLLLLSIIVIILVRAWTDTFLFLGFYDFILVYLLLLVFDKEPLLTD